MKNGFREKSILLLILASLVAFLWHRAPNSGGWFARSDEGSRVEELIVWNSDKPVGKTWESLGPDGKIDYPDNSGLDGKGQAFTIKMTAKGFRGCGLNWKGWFPDDACDNASRYTSLTFHIRQVTAIEDVEISVALMDNLKRAKGDLGSNTLAVTVEGGIPRIDREWRRVVIPLAKFTQNKSLRLDRLWGIDFSNNGSDEIVIQVDRIGFSSEKPNVPAFPSGPTFKAAARIDVAMTGHTISDRIYGVCSLPSDKLSEYGIPVTRWGGNPSSRYNWKINADNGAGDWFFKNRGKAIQSLSENGYLKHIQSMQALGGTTYQTIPMLGWVAKDNSSYSYSVKKFGKQTATEPGHADIGNGIGPDGKPIQNADPHDTSMEAGPDFIAEAVDYLAKQAGRADGADGKPGVQYWVLDNEPMLWHDTHRDVRSQPLGYDELWDRTVRYAEAIKKADPTAKVAGFCSWGWTDLYYSAKDEGNDHYGAKTDHRAHGQQPIAEWFIRKCGEYKKKHGKPLIDVFDFHWYPQCQANGNTPFQGKGADPALNELRLRSTRDLWDPDYTQESWIKNTVDHKPTQVIRRIRAWIERHNPGMEMCIGEYNFGGSDNITGGLAQADVFGILAREKVDLAFIWHTPEGTQNNAWQLYRSYDGSGGRFGDQLIEASTANKDLSIHAAKRKDGAVTIVAINKNLSSPCDLTIDAKGLQGKLRIWRFDQTSGKVIETKPESSNVDGKIVVKLPAASASMLVVK